MFKFKVLFVVALSFLFIGFFSTISFAKGDGHHYPAHIAGVFVGATDANDKTELTTGLEYEYRFNKYFGFGFIGEHTPAAVHPHDTHDAADSHDTADTHDAVDSHAIAAAVDSHDTADSQDTADSHATAVSHDGISAIMCAVHFHPVGGLRLTGGAGLEYIHQGSSANHKALYRLGVAYDFELGAVAIAPTFNVDFVNDEEILVYGVVFATHF